MKLPKVARGYPQSDRSQEICQDLQEGIRKHLQLFHRLAETLEDPLERMYGVIAKAKGILGIAFFDANSSIATVFADTTDSVPENIEIDEKFVFPIKSNILTTVLSNRALPQTGVVVYQRAWDEYSDSIKIDHAFRSFVPPFKSNRNYALFYHRYHPGNNNELPMTCLYYCIPAPGNVVVHKRNWEGFVQYSFSLLQNIYNAIRALYNTRYEGDTYLKSLLDCCVPLSPELESLEKEGEQLWERKGHHQFFHTIKHKLSNISKFLNPDIAVQQANEIKYGDYSQARMLLQQLSDEVDAIYRIDTGNSMAFSVTSIRDLLTEHGRISNSFTRMLNSILRNNAIKLNKPHASISLSTRVQHCPELYAIFLFEIFCNLYQHSTNIWKATFNYCSLKEAGEHWLGLRVINIAEPNAFESIRCGDVTANHRNRRMKGLGVIELIQEHIKAPPWDVRILDVLDKTVEFKYPFAKMITD